jgi:cytochrome b
MGNRAANTLGAFFVFAVLFNLAWVCGVGWVAGSAITSGVKAAKDQCGTRYGVESVFSGNWFCPEDE